MAARFTDWREARRFRAYELHQQDWGPTRIAEALGVSKGAVSQWLSRADAQGLDALRAKPRPSGLAQRLTEDELERLPQLLQQGAPAYGFEGDRWTRGRVAKVIKKEFGVSYSVWQVGRILRLVGFSLQKPARKAAERDEEAIERWKQERLPALEKKCSS